MVALIVERRGNSAERIAVEEWQGLVASRDDLRIRTEPYIAVNPATNQTITLPLGEADSEVLVDGQWLPFLRFRRGTLVTEYEEDFEDPSNPIRIKIAQVSKHLDAVIATDLGDEVFKW